MKELEEIKKVSNLWDPVYDRFNSKESGRNSVWNEKPTPFFVRNIDYLKHLGIEKYGVMGCGDGRNIKPFLDAEFQVIAIDGSESAIKACEKLYVPNKNLILMQGILENTQLESNSLDALMCDHVLIHIENINKVITEFRRVLKPGGCALIEFSSLLDSIFGQGVKLSDNVYIKENFYQRFDTIGDIHKHMKGFEICSIAAEYSTDPKHGKGYIREGRHMHHSYFVFAKKPKQNPAHQQ